MVAHDDEDERLRSVALQNAQSIFLARQRAEEELVRAKEALELKTAELAKSLAMMRATLESTSDGILVTDGGDTVTSFNQRFVTMWGVPNELVAAREQRQLLLHNSQHFADPGQFLARVDEIYASSPPSSYDLLELQDGRMLERFSRIQVVDDRNVGRVWSFRDITEQRSAVEALRKHSEKLRVTLTSIGDAVITADTDGRVVSLNPVAESLTGWTEVDAQGMELDRVFQIVNEQSRQPTENPIARSLREGRVVGLANHTVLISKDGTERAIDDSAAPIRDAHGIIVGVVLVFRDVTEERKSVAALNRAAQTTRFLANASAALSELTDYESTLQRIAGLAVPIFSDWCVVDVRNADGTVRRLSITHHDPAKIQLIRALQERHAIAPDEVRNPPPALRSGESELVTEISDSVLKSFVQDDDTLRTVRALGVKSYISVPLKSRNEAALGTLTFVSAESGRVYDADDLRAAEDLAHRATIAIENANLVGALKESDRRKDEFLAVLAHELRNPLAPVRNALEIIRAKAPPMPELKWAGDIIDRQVDQMTRLVDDLLDVSRISSGKIDLRKERIELAAVVRDAVEACLPLLEKRRHEVTVTLPPEPLILDADPTRLAQILSNLLNNAAKYTDKGGRIWLTVARVGAEVEIRVKDTGVGITPSMLPRVFDMFTQGDLEMDRSHGGLGIGLTLAKRLVELHGGTVEAQSAGPGRGSEFIVRLPAATTDRPHTAPGGTAGEATPEPVPEYDILVVDDNRDAADSLTMLLRMTGHRVRTAYDGLEAEGAATQFQPAIVFLDLGMPKLNGYEVARRIRADRGNAVVLVALTGWGQAEDRRRSSEAGFDYHLTKPVDPDALRTLVAGVHDRHFSDAPGRMGTRGS